MIKNGLRFFIFLSLAVSLSFFAGSGLSVYGGSFKILGTRPQGMGGAFVAVAEGTDAAYWNPAGLGITAGNFPTGGVALPVGANLEATGGILNSAKKISDSADAIAKIQKAQEDGTSVGLDDLKVFSQALKNLKEMEGTARGIQADVTGGIGVKLKGWSVSVNNFSSVGVNPFVDMSGIYLGSATITSLSFPSQTHYPSLTKYLVSAEDLAGIDLSKLQTDYSSYFSTASPAGLSSESASLSDSVSTLSNAAGVKITGYTPEQIANALINIAKSQGVTDEDIKNAVSQIGAAIPIIQDFISGAKTFKENNSNLSVRGISATELVFSYGRELPYFEKAPFLKGVSVGANIKYVLAQTFYSKQYFLKGESVEMDDFSNLINKNTAQSSALALDLGLLWRRSDWIFKPSAGLLARNLNSPKFSMPTSAQLEGINDYTLDCQTRGGIALRPFDWWLIACDLDITDNKTEIDGYNSRNFSIGNEFNIVNKRYFNFAIRSGLIKNLAFESSPLTYTGGIGINIYGFNLDISGALSSDTVSVPVSATETREIPSRAMLSLAMSFAF